MSEQASWSEEAGKALAGGNLLLANLLSGKWYSITGTVVHGDHLGRNLGFPTANLVPEENAPLLVPYGVYAVRCRVGDKTHPGVANVGVRPTVEGKTLRVEAHLLNWTCDLYGMEITIEFIARIREEKKFGNLDELVRQINEDIATARSILT